MCKIIFFIKVINSVRKGLKKSEAKLSRETRKQRQLLSESGLVLCTAPTSLSRNRSIKMKKSIYHFSFIYSENLIFISAWILV